MIDRFRGDHRFLSNFYPAIVSLDGERYPSVEHAYQAAKTLVYPQRMAIKSVREPGYAKKIGSCVDIRADWDNVKLAVMEDLVRQKFTQDPNLCRRLLLTGHEELIEGNNWGDRFWGVCRGEGENHLGKILMKVRGELRATSERNIG